ncbi:hypothetical protein OQZ33_04405 [Pedobacter sp. MC2016-05]|uniref:hypothetical protein n=1 Tax=Pedobacter sp. MC2016-05 TaxID=2994474 RepID=UPI0022466A50|nr:hypothetical protein [Pedobacter sp. MC2016-05]MCX2473568.1 hypothetical protein [Pedobacter sp. MC2016-05]
MKDNITFVDKDIAVLSDHRLIVAMESEPVAALSSSPRPKEESGTNGVAFWGDDNLFPQNLLKEAEADTELSPLLDWKGRVLQGKEIIAVNMVWNEIKKDFDVVRINDEEINSFLSNIRTKRYWREACVDFTWFQNIFPDLIKNKGLDKIVSIGTHDAAWCRWGLMDKKGNITECFVSAQWEDSPKPTEKEKVDTHPVIDPYDADVIEKLLTDKKIKRFVYPVNYPSPGKAYYPLAAWTSFVFSAWFKIKKKIPTWKLKFMERVLSANKFLNIPLSYWPSVHKDWHKLTTEQQAEIKKAKVMQINEQLSGENGVGKTILSEVGLDENNKELPSFKIVPIESGFKDGEHLEDSQEASQHLNRALNVDPTLVGSGPGRGNDAGSGSDKRVAFNIYTAILQPHREVILEPLYFIAQFNKWTDKYKNLRFIVKEVDLQTLDQGNTSIEKNPVTPVKTTES